MDKKKIKIVTHSSKFHSDDVFAVATLMLVLEKAKPDNSEELSGRSTPEGFRENEVEVIRSRDPEIIKTADYVVDIGGVYNPEKNLFDHHQEDKAGERENGVPFASFGLVWKKYGEELCGNKAISNKIDLLLVQPIDAHDNGIQYIKTNISNLYPFDVISFVYSFRPTWKEDDVDIDIVFMKVVALAKIILERVIFCAKDEFEAVSMVEKAYQNTSDKRIIVLDERYPWEEILTKYPEPLFVVYPKRIDNTWSLKTIRDNSRDFIARKDLPLDWAGKRDSDLEKVTGVEGSVFCHNNRFLAMTKTKEGALALAEIALKS